MKKQSDTQKNVQSALNRQKRIRIALIICLILVLIPLVSLAIGVTGFAIYASTQSVDATLLPTANSMPIYYDVDGNELPTAESDFVDSELISDNLKHAFVAIEDKRFYEHNGYDTVRMASAAIKNLKAGTVREGASTITQQLVKNTHLTQERTLSRKLKELAIAIQLEKQYSKDEILAMYLSVIYFGSGAYGVKQAANTFFAKPVEDLTLAECATLAGLIRNPSKYSPTNSPEHSRKRRNTVLSVMLAQGYINKSEYDTAANEPVVTADNSHFQTPSGTISLKACEFYISQAQNEVCNTLGITKYQLNNSGIKIYTNLDSALQVQLEKQRMSVQNYESEDISSVSIVIDNQNGAVLAYSSSYPYAISRQAGSVLKPLAVYAPAIDRGLVSLATPIVDEKVDFGGYSPRNFGGVYYGDTTVREAIKRSMNSVSVKVLDYLGTDLSASYLSKLNLQISDADKSYALALGATQSGVSPLSVAGGYSTLARGGNYVEPSFVRYVVQDGIKTVFSDNEERGLHAGKKVFMQSTAELITDALLDTTKTGTAKSLSTLPFDVASKTGTAERADGSNSDAWNASYNEQFTVLVWHGIDGAMTERGGGYPTRHALNIWRELDKTKAVARHFSPYEKAIKCEVDTYSSKISKKVVASTQLTPIEYRKTELFASDSIPTASGSKFDKLAPTAIKIQNENGKINLAFDSESIYTYELYRKDVTGMKYLYSGVGTDKEIQLSDRPLSFDGKVDYTLICYLKGNEEISASSSKSVYVKDANYYD